MESRWSSLSDDYLNLIFDYVGPMDGSVCKQWARSSTWTKISQFRSLQILFPEALSTRLPPENRLHLLDQKIKRLYKILSLDKRLQPAITAALVNETRLVRVDKTLLAKRLENHLTTLAELISRMPLLYRKPLQRTLKRTACIAVSGVVIFFIASFFAKNDDETVILQCSALVFAMTVIIASACVYNRLKIPSTELEVFFGKSLLTIRRELGVRGDPPTIPIETSIQG